MPCCHIERRRITRVSFVRARATGLQPFLSSSRICAVSTSLETPSRATGMLGATWAKALRELHEALTQFSLRYSSSGFSGAAVHQPL